MTVLWKHPSSKGLPKFHNPLRLIKMQDPTPAENEAYATRSIMRNIRRRDMDICLLSLPPALLRSLCFSKPSCALQQGECFAAAEMLMASIWILTSDQNSQQAYREKWTVWDFKREIRFSLCNLAMGTKPRKQHSLIAKKYARPLDSNVIKPICQYQPELYKKKLKEKNAQTRLLLTG